MSVLRALCVLCVLCGTANEAQAQQRWSGRVRGAFNALVQTDAAGLSQSFTLVKNREPAPITAELASTTVPFFDGGIIVRLVGNVGAGVAFSSLARTDQAAITARLPHPFFFNQPRALDGTSSVEHKELATHLSGVYVVVSRRLDVALLAGLSLFQVHKDFVADVVATESFPYDTATFERAEIVRENVTKAGFHGGADLTWKLGVHWGVGGLLRYAKVSVPFARQPVDAGGLQAGGGLRVRF